jgi:antitoxin component of MazEF toxin-antitoxin module
MLRGKVRREGEKVLIELPGEAAGALHLAEGDELAVVAEGETIVLSRTTADPLGHTVDFAEAWAAYLCVEPRYTHANRKLAR